MNNSTAIAETPPAPTTREKLVVHDASSISYLMDTARFEHCYRIAKLMASASLIPDHLKTVGPANNKRPLEPDQIAANCFMIVNQALRWGFDPFAVAPETYVVGGKLAFQGKLVAAAINALAGLEGRLNYDFSGAGKDLTITVTGRFKGETKDRTVTVSVRDAETDNQMWRKDPEQKLVYSGSIKWARRHCPEVVMGIILDDEIETMRDVTPTGTTSPTGNPFEERLKAAGEPATATKPAAEPVKEAEVVEEPIEEVKKRIRTAMGAAKLKATAANKILLDAGLLPEGATLQTATEEQFRTIDKRLDLFKPKEAPGAAPIYVDSVDVSNLPAKLSYKQGGQIHEAVTSARDLIALMETLNPDEEIVLMVDPQKNGAAVITKLELKEGGEQ